VVVVVWCERNRARRDVRPNVNQSCRIARSSVRRTVSIVAARAASDGCQRSASIARQGDVARRIHGTEAFVESCCVDGRRGRESGRKTERMDVCACVSSDRTSACAKRRRGIDARDREKERERETAYRSVYVACERESMSVHIYVSRSMRARTPRNRGKSETERAHNIPARGIRLTRSSPRAVFDPRVRGSPRIAIGGGLAGIGKNSVTIRVEIRREGASRPLAADGCDATCGARRREDSEEVPREHSIRPSSSTPSARPPAPPIRGLVTLPPRPLRPRLRAPGFLDPAFRARERRDVALEEWRDPVLREISPPRRFWRDFRRMRAKCRSLSHPRAGELARGFSRGLSLHNDLSIAPDTEST